MKSREQFWAEHIAGWRESGLTARDYAATAGINPLTLKYMKCVLKKQAQDRARVTSPRPAALPLIEVRTSAQDERFEIGFADGKRLRVPAVFEPGGPPAAARFAREGGVIPAEVRIFVCTEPVDMRYGFDRLVQIARERVGQDPVEGGALFVFGGRKATRLKLLWFERNGLCLLYKRLHRAVFEVPVGTDGARSIRIDGVALARMLAGVARPNEKGEKILGREARAGLTGRSRPCISRCRERGAQHRAATGEAGGESRHGHCRAR